MADDNRKQPDGIIRVDAEVDPALDPDSPEFDLDKWIETTEFENMGAIYEKLLATLQPMLDSLKANFSAFGEMQQFFNSPNWTPFQKALQRVAETAPALLEMAKEIRELTPYLDEELQKPKYKGKSIDDLFREAETDENGSPEENSLFMQIITAARAARDADQVIAAQNAGRERRRQMKEEAEKAGAIMDIRDGILPVLSARGMWDAFAPGKISRIGTLASDYINSETGRIEKTNFEEGEIVSLNAAEISYKTLVLLSAIVANSVENFRDYFVLDGTISFYVKGVLDRLEVDPRIKNDGQLNLDRKTAGVLYLEKQFAPLLMFVGTTPDGSRYSVLNYDGYDVNTDTMKIRTPYLYQIWKATQDDFAARKKRREQRIAEGKKPFKKDLKPLEVNTLFKGTAYKEDDAVLEIATYITNILLNAGKGAHKTDILYTTLIRDCPRLREKLEEIKARPKVADGKKVNNTARYNVELRKIGRAFSLIMNPDKCDALKHFEFEEFYTKTKDGGQEFVAPTKSTLDGKIHIKWRRIDADSK